VFACALQCLEQLASTDAARAAAVLDALESFATRSLRLLGHPRRQALLALLCASVASVLRLGPQPDYHLSETRRLVTGLLRGVASAEVEEGGADDAGAGAGAGLGQLLAFTMQVAAEVCSAHVVEAVLPVVARVVAERPLAVLAVAPGLADLGARCGRPEQIATVVSLFTSSLHALASIVLLGPQQRPGAQEAHVTNRRPSQVRARFLFLPSLFFFSSYLLFDPRVCPFLLSSCLSFSFILVFVLFLPAVGLSVGRAVCLYQ
jgi:hypothetical protein